MSSAPPDDDGRAERMLRGLGEAPKHVGLSLRGMEATTPRPYAGQTVVSSWLVPTSVDPLVATRNLELTRLLAVTGDAGADVRPFSAHPEEREVVYLPGTIFVMGPTEVLEGVEVTFVDQADPGRDPAVAARFDIETVRPLVRRLLAAARDRAPVALTRPEKFVGPLG